MTVNELIEVLKTFPEKAHIILPYREEVNSVYYDKDSNEVEIRW